MHLAISQLNEKLQSLLNKDYLLNLACGKMSICLYYYYLSKKYNNKEFEKFAENILNEIFEKVNTIHIVDLMLGLSGIGLGIRYLIKNSYAAGNINEVL